ncbi:hypothetical protein AB835_07700 [Candidatus Endobugula sertula]|uniref:Uncharacterized protein n=1 Tax=Candidatus Endobugula sertula TaxID=62101 RepID=A0A1D2QQ21_9GAMM|nr:hypothetical protein AB835_07700 [Candidatus Endobugula sertula]
MFSSREVIYYPSPSADACWAVLSYGLTALPDTVAALQLQLQLQRQQQPTLGISTPSVKFKIVDWLDLLTMSFIIFSSALKTLLFF